MRGTTALMALLVFAPAAAAQETKQQTKPKFDTVRLHIEGQRTAPGLPYRNRTLTVDLRDGWVTYTETDHNLPLRRGRTSPTRDGSWSGPATKRQLSRLRASLTGLEETVPESIEPDRRLGGWFSVDARAAKRAVHSVQPASRLREKTPLSATLKALGSIRTHVRRRGLQFNEVTFVETRWIRGTPHRTELTVNANREVRVRARGKTFRLRATPQELLELERLRTSTPWRRVKRPPVAPDPKVAPQFALAFRSNRWPHPQGISGDPDAHVAFRTEAGPAIVALRNLRNRILRETGAYVTGSITGRVIERPGLADRVGSIGREPAKQKQKQKK